MRLVSISRETLVNPEHISHITYKLEPEKSFGPVVYRITMADGHYYDVQHQYFNENYPWMNLDGLLRDIERPR